MVLGAGRLLALARALRLDRLAPPAQRAATPPASLREMLRPIPSSLGSGPTAAVLAGCVMDVAYRPTQRATMRAVAASGRRALRSAPGGCCGALAMHYGQPEAARAMARERIPEARGRRDCSRTRRAQRPRPRLGIGQLLADDPEWAERAERVAAKVVDLIELELPERDRGLGRVAVHHACHHLHAQHIEPRAMLRRAGAECVDLGDGGRCCGAAGLYSVLQPELAGRLRAQKAQAIAATGAPVVAVANPGCAIQIQAGLREIGSTVRVAHPADLVAPPGVAPPAGPSHAAPEMAVDLVIDIENTPGALAQVAAAISDAGVNIAAATCIGGGERAELHILVPHAEAARHPLAISHVAVTREREVVVVDVEDRPGVLADLTRRSPGPGSTSTSSTSPRATAWSSVARPRRAPRGARAQ